ALSRRGLAKPLAAPREPPSAGRPRDGRTPQGGTRRLEKDRKDPALRAPDHKRSATRRRRARWAHQEQRSAGLARPRARHAASPRAPCWLVLRPRAARGDVIDEEWYGSVVMGSIPIPI